MTRCAICQNFSVKGSPLRHIGLYNCKLMKSYEFPNPFIERKCNAFSQVPPEQMEARIKWEKQV